MKAQLAQVLNQEMDRKEFLRYVGVALLMLAGGGAIMQAFGALRPGTSQTSGYGGNTYGGRR